MWPCPAAHANAIATNLAANRTTLWIILTASILAIIIEVIITIRICKGRD